MNYTAVYFSPTGTSEKSAVSMTEALAAGKEFGRVDLTPCSAREAEIVFTSQDFVVFGSPVYGGRIPEAAAQRFRRMRGGQTPCLVTVTYGNRDYDDALVELADIAESNGFLVQAAAALVGQHTFGRIQVGRPNEEDAEENRRFIKVFLSESERSLNKTGTKPLIKGNRPYREGGKRRQVPSAYGRHLYQMRSVPEKLPGGAPSGRTAQASTRDAACPASAAFDAVL